MKFDRPFDINCKHTLIIDILLIEFMTIKIN